MYIYTSLCGWVIPCIHYDVIAANLVGGIAVGRMCVCADDLYGESPGDV